MTSDSRRLPARQIAEQISEALNGLTELSSAPTLDLIDQKLRELEYAMESIRGGDVEIIGLSPDDVLDEIRRIRGQGSDSANSLSDQLKGLLEKFHVK